MKLKEDNVCAKQHKFDRIGHFKTFYKIGSRSVESFDLSALALKAAFKFLLQLFSKVQRFLRTS
jgi:hypothetical protein